MVSVEKHIDYFWIHLEKTGSSTIINNLAKIDAKRKSEWEVVYVNTLQELISRYDDVPVVSSIRNPYTWCVSYWNYFSLRDPNEPGLGRCQNFEEWVRKQSGHYVKLYKERIPDGAHMIRMEHQKEDLRRILEEIRGPLSQDTIQIITAILPRKVNRTERDKPYREYYTDETLEIVRTNCRFIFEKHYPDYTFPDENFLFYAGYDRVDQFLPAFKQKN